MSKWTLIVMVKMKPISNEPVPLRVPRRAALQRQLEADREERARAAPHGQHAGDLGDEVERIELDQHVEARKP